MRHALALALLAASAHALLDDTLEILKLSKDIGTEVLGSWDLISRGDANSSGVDLPIIRRREKLVLSRLAHVSDQIERLQLEMEKTGALAIMLFRQSHSSFLLEQRLQEIGELLSQVERAEANMRDYVRLQDELERSTLEDFAHWCVSHDAGALPGVLESVYSAVVPPHAHILGRGLLQRIADDMQDDTTEMCELQVSPQQLVFDLYNTVSLAEIKGYAMMQFSWMLLRIYGKGNFSQEASLTRARYGKRTHTMAAYARSAMAAAKRGLYRCDPAEHVPGETFAEVTELLQGYIVNEVDLNNDGTCRENCPFYNLAQHHDCYQELFCKKQRMCRGRIIDCQYIDSDMTVCQANSRGNRRYDWIEYENGRVLGKSNTCTKQTTKVDSWWRWLFWHCSYCMCLCDDAGPKSDRYFSLHEATADAANNKIVTGMRIVKLDRVFHLQVSEGTLGERGAVRPEGWVPVQRFDPNEISVQEGVDYHMLSYEQRAIDLDELDSEKGYILTGIRFRMHGSHLHFEIRSTPFNYTTGRLAPEKSYWISNDNTDGSDKPRRKYSLSRADIPVRSLTPHPVDSEHDQFLEFTNSDFDADAAQSTVPFIDVQPIQPQNGAAMLSGAGVVHRGARGSGGFIALKAFTYDYTSHVRADVPPASFDDPADATEYAPVVN